MKAETRTNLRRARADFGRCAQIISSRATPAKPLTPTDREKLIAVGTARDWVRWSGSLNGLSFASKSEEKSARTAGIEESIRFNQMWTATNALFARDSVLALTTLANLPASEAKRFQLLYQFSPPNPIIETQCLETLKQLLGMECNAKDIVSVISPGNNPTMWEVIDQKYTRPIDRTRGLGRVIANALNAQQLPNPDGPTLIYGARNWAVHGMLLTSFFRGSRQKYLTFIDNVTLLLSLVLRSAAANLVPLV
jgi:hypothetical protein